MIVKYIARTLYKLECLRRTARILLADSIIPKSAIGFGNAELKVAIFKRGGIGDWIIYSKPLGEFKRKNPSADITIYCENRQLKIVELIALHSRIKIITEENRRKFLHRHRLLSEIRKENYDLWIDSDIARTNFGDAACLASQAKIRVGFAASNHAPCHKFIENRLFTHRLEDDLGKTHMLNRFYNLLGYAANLLAKNNNTPEEDKKIKSGLDKYRWNGHKSDYFVIAPGASSKTRIWPIERFSSLIKKVADAYELKPLVVGSDSDKDVCQSIERQLGSYNIRNLAGTLNIDDLFRIIINSRFIITNDSGPMHIGRLTETPTLAIVSGADFESYPNYSEKKTCFQVVHSSYTACFNCQWNCTQPNANKKPIKPCLDAVTMEMAWERINNIYYNTL